MPRLYKRRRRPAGLPRMRNACSPAPPAA